MLANRIIVQTIETEFSIKVFSWRQSKCHRDTDLDSHVGKSAANFGS
jgi:hypothetical protein